MRVLVAVECKMVNRLFLFLGALFLLGACAHIYPVDKIDPTGNLTRKDYTALRERGLPYDTPTNKEGNEDQEDTIDLPPPPIPQLPVLPTTPIKKSLPIKNEKLVSLSVTENVPLRDVLIELGRSGEVNLELDPRINGGVIFSAHAQPFPEVLQHICALAGLRYKVDGAFVRIELDEPYQQTYNVEYLSLSRKTTTEVGISTNVFDGDITSNNNSTSSRSGADNNSVSKVTSSADSDFWAELDKSLTQIMASSHSRPLTTSTSKENSDKNQSPSFSIDRQAGLVTVTGSSRQQEAIENYLQRLQRKASTQVLIEARIVEVELNDAFQSGINWRTLMNHSVDFAGRFGTVGAGAPFTSATTAADGVFTASIKDGDFSGILNLVKTFGTTRILSSPRLTVLNNQTAVLKVARNEVYFLTSAQFPTTLSASGVSVSGNPVFSSTPRTVPVGLVMTVQPSIDGERGRVTMTLRPTISRIVNHVEDPSIGLNAAQAGITSAVSSRIPVLAVREMDSVLQLNSGEVAIMGGLMQDSSINEDQGLPFFDSLPLIGNLVKSRDNQGTTSELVILLRATILENPVPDEADSQLYHRYNRDPRPLPLPRS